jgi:hypothetical protein
VTTKRTFLRIALCATVLLLWTAAAAPPAAADSVVYVTGLGNEFGTLDLATGAFNQIAILNLPAGDLMYGMGFSGGNLYGVDSEPDANLWQINPGNGALTNLGAIGQSATDATTDSSGKFYVLSQDVNAVYYTLNPPSPTPTVMGMTNISSTGMMAVNSNGTQLFTTTLNTMTGTYNLVSLNPANGAATVLGDTGFTPDAGLFVGGTLYGFDTSMNAIITLNTTTGTGTMVATYNLPNGDIILAAASVPEPSSLVLGLVGTIIGGLAVLARRRRAG